MALCDLLHSAGMIPTRRTAGEGRRATGARTGLVRRPLPEESAEALRVLGGVLIGEVDGLADRLTVMVLQREPIYAELDMVEERRSAGRANMERGGRRLA